MYNMFNPNDIKPTGWLRRQLELQAAGLSGNLDKMWPDIRDSKWIGGDYEGWERVPYWLDGFIPLAYLLDDDDMKKRADNYIFAILDRQQEDGWICPCTNEERKTYDVWAAILISKVLTLYYSFTENERAKDGLYRSMKCLYQLLSNGEIKLFDWGKFRWFEGLIALELLRDEYNEDWILKLAELLEEQGADYPKYKDTWVRPINKWTYHTHNVNIAMMLKYEALSSEISGKEFKNMPEKLWQFIEKYNGTAVGTFTGDECLSGKHNNQGTEFCSVVEFMYSLEILYRMTGDPVWADRLEKIAFNAMPATISDDMWTHQYDQLVNQMACLKFAGRAIFRTNGDMSHLFGLEPNFGCCTANFNQGWPKLAMNVFEKSEKGILCAFMLPSKLNTNLDGVNVSVEIVTDYPFRNTCKYIVKTDKPALFELKIRIPSTVKLSNVNGENVEMKDYCVISKVWNGEETITLELDRTPHLVTRENGLKVAEYGPLVFSLPIKTEYIMHEYEKDRVERKFPYCDYELNPQSDWNYGFADDEFEVKFKDGDDIPFSSKNPSIVLSAKMAKVDWELEDGYEAVSAVLPNSDKPISESEMIELYPYGCAKLRMTEMPKLKMD